jgi:group I intron endonuclease
MTGIYKILNPIGKIYIGASKNINSRWSAYKRLACKAQPKILESLILFGVDNHIFEIIEQTSIEDLNCKERFWQDKFNVLGEKGLNCMLTECGDMVRVYSEEVLLKKSLQYTGDKNPMYGKTWTDSAKNEMSKRVSGEGNPNFGKTHSDETKNKISLSNIGRSLGGKSKLSKIVLCLETGIFYDCIKDASYAYGINYSTLKRHLNGYTPNKTNLIQC